MDEGYASRVTTTGAPGDILTFQGRDLRPGLSGAPVVNAQGQVVGIFGGGASGGAGAGFATPSSQIETYWHRHVR